MVYTPPLYDAFLIDSVARLNKKNAQTVYLINRLRILLNRNQFSKDFKQFRHAVAFRLNNVLESMAPNRKKSIPFLHP